jgi:hypothetical protein
MMEMANGFLEQHTDHVLFNLATFRDLCRDGEKDPDICASASECLLDAVMEICRVGRDVAPAPPGHSPIEVELLSDAVMDACGFIPNTAAPHLDLPLVKAELHAARTAFENNMPTLFERSKARAGFSALLALASSSTWSDDIEGNERRSQAVGNAQRFGKTLGAYVVSFRAAADRPVSVN